MLNEAADANRSTPGRRGQIVEVAEGGDMLVTGDLHGNRPNWNWILRRAKLDENPERHLLIQEVVHGGPAYPNGGCMSHTMLEDVARMKTRFPERFHFILGNHELSELTGYPIMKRGSMLNFLFRLGVESAYESRAEDVMKAYHTFIQSLPYAVKLPNGVMIVHTVPSAKVMPRFNFQVYHRAAKPHELQKDGAVFELTWGRDYDEANIDRFVRTMGAKVLIGGHEPCQDGFATPNRRQVILDCCKKPATCVMLDLAADDISQEQIVEKIEKF